MLLCLTSNHRNASFDLLEKLSIGAPSAAELLTESTDAVAGAVIVATCNRFEAYLEVDDAQQHSATEAAVALFSSASGVAAAELRDAVDVKTGDDVVAHLFAVSSGLESVVVGEDEIAGQVRRSLTRARQRGTTSSGLERLFQRASHTSRDVKTVTDLGGAGRSLVRLALELASSRIADWSAVRVLLIGTGQYAGTTVAALRDRGAEAIDVFSHSGRAAAFATRHSLRARTDLAAALADADVVIACTTTAVIDAGLVAASDRRRLLIDLGLPRNIDAAVAGLPGVELLDLETISLHAPLEQLSAATDARALVGTAAAAFAADRAVEPGIVALRSHIMGLLDAEVERSARRGEGDATAAALRHFASVLLHGPSERARTLARDGRGAEFLAGLDAVYGLAATPAAAEGRGVA